MKLLTNKQRESYVTINLTINMLKIKNIVKLKTIVTIQGNIEVLDTAYVI